MADAPLLLLQRLGVSYGHVRAVESVDLVVQPGETVAILGANGAGKSSIVRAVAGLVQAGGTITFGGQRIERLPSHRRAALGLGYVPEGRRVFADMTVLENLLVGAHLQPSSASQGLDTVFATFPRLAERRRQLAATLSGGEQQMLAIGRAMMRLPLLLVLDEPSLGLSPILVQVIYRALLEIRQRGVAVLLAEQSAHLALNLADRAYVLETGRVVLQDTARALRGDPRIAAAYLGDVETGVQSSM
jgi:branched-chain amino acid transport system ATP-binding protein